jgi:hypothetical protein
VNYFTIFQEAKKLVARILEKNTIPQDGQEINYELSDFDTRYKDILTLSQHRGYDLADVIKSRFNSTHAEILDHAMLHDGDRLKASKIIKIELSKAIIQRLAGSASKN